MFRFYYESKVIISVAIDHIQELLYVISGPCVLKSLDDEAIISISVDEKFSIQSDLINHSTYTKDRFNFLLENDLTFGYLESNQCAVHIAYHTC